MVSLLLLFVSLMTGNAGGCYTTHISLECPEDQKIKIINVTLRLTDCDTLLTGEHTYCYDKATQTRKKDKLEGQCKRMKSCVVDFTKGSCVILKVMFETPITRIYTIINIVYPTNGAGEL